MEEETTNKPTKGTWDRIGEIDPNRITFDINVPIKVTFLVDAPEEIPSTMSEGQVFYRFKVKYGEDSSKYFDSSAWTLLSALKSYAPLIGKTVTITKKLVKRKQNFEVVLN
jgi:hypothetical protein